MLEKNWKKTLLNKNSNIKKAVQCLEINALRIILVIDKQKKLLGTITDGDLRRGLLKGLKLNSPITNLINKKFFYATKFMSTSYINKMMYSNQIHHMPILDKDKKVLGLKVLGENSLIERKKNLIIIMAGGRGSRMMPLTKRLPKPLLHVRNKPILEHILLKAKSEGFRKFIFSINYLGYMIKNFFGDGSKWNVKIKYLKEDHPLGTAGSLSLLNPKPTTPFIVCNGDVISEIGFNDLLNFHIKNNCVASLAVKPYELRNPYGVVKVNGNRIIDIKEKPISKSYINTGVYAFNPKILRFIKKNKHLDMNLLIQNLSKNSKKVLAYPAYENWLDVGKPADYKKAKRKK